MLNSPLARLINKKPNTFPDPLNSSNVKFSSDILLNLNGDLHGIDLSLIVNMNPALAAFSFFLKILLRLPRDAAERRPTFNWGWAYIYYCSFPFPCFFLSLFLFLILY